MFLPYVMGFKLLEKLSDGMIANYLVLIVKYVQNLWSSMATSLIKLCSSFILIVLVDIVARFTNLTLDVNFLFSCVDKGISELSLAYHTTIANISLEYSATISFSPIDHVTLQYLKIFERCSTSMLCIILLRVTCLFL